MARTETETIAQIATPKGIGGIGIIRISGPKAESILYKIYKPAKREHFEHRKLTYGHIFNPETGEIIDEVMAVFMKAPHTYTTEDVAEIDCHGGTISLKKILSIVFKIGARPARNGEFTKRAFLGGRIDLSQAEAVAELIEAQTDRGFDLALKKLAGAYSEKINLLREKLTEILVQITVNIDYPDEDIEEIVYANLKNAIDGIRSDVARLVNAAGTGKILKNGINVAIIGKPNVGKSSLMNNLLRESRSIVTEIPGTTRDTIEEKINIDGVPVTIIDTAGIHDTSDTVEKIGIERSKDSCRKADIVIIMAEACKKSLDDSILADIPRDRKKCLFVFNKVDLGREISQTEAEQLAGGGHILFTSMKKAEDIEAIEEKLADILEAITGTVNEDEITLSEVTLKNLKQADSFLKDSMEAIEQKLPLEFIETDISSAYESLGFIIGDSVRDDVIDDVFSRFCLGK